jgi:inositol phosphorylceramide mannosyltransferase catalytic subunit
MIASWKKLHPTWKVYVWTDKEAKTYPFINKAAFDAAKNLSEKSDIWRYELLYRFGGIYSDTDVECVQPFDILCKSCDFFAGLESDEYLGSAIIGSIPRHPLMFECFFSIQPGPGDNNVQRIQNKAGVKHFNFCFLENAEKYSPHITCLPPVYFYPFDWRQIHQAPIEWLKQHYVKRETMAIHYWGGRWIPKRSK